MNKTILVPGGKFVGIQITTDQVVALAPDASSIKAGKKLGESKHWKNLGQSPEALWGECQGSALYQVRVECSTLTIQCSCPSRKQPCKHGLGLLFLAISSAEAVPEIEPPEWIVSWLAKRAAVNKRKETLQSKSSEESSATQAKTIEKRKAQVSQGIEQLDRWLNDLIRNGLGSLETQPFTFWEQQARQMVDAKAPGLASRIRTMGTIPNASPNWPEKLLAHCGQLALLTQAYKRIDQLEPALQEDVRQYIGWSLKEEEVLARGERVSDEWFFMGQLVEEIERGLAQRTWLLGSATRKPAMILQFSIAGAGFPTVYPSGIRQRADLVYWPGVAPQRALIERRRGEIAPLQERLPGCETIDDFFGTIAALQACQPWQERFLCVLNEVIPLYDQVGNQWWIRDTNGQGLPLAKGELWQLLAFSGGGPIDFAGEWNGEMVSPLGILVEGQYHRL
jgi:hypothetical protein